MSKFKPSTGVSPLQDIATTANKNKSSLEFMGIMLGGVGDAVEYEGSKIISSGGDAISAGESATSDVSPEHIEINHDITNGTTKVW